jgi:6-phosphogluconolactonase
MAKQHNMRFSKAAWAGECASLVQTAIEVSLFKRGKCSIMLTGGRSGRALFEALCSLQRFNRSENLDIFWGDERCVSPHDIQSNYRLALDSLFNGNPFPEGKSLFRMEAESTDPDGACLRYEKLLPEVIDIILLGVGEDGHVASLFPHSSALHETGRRVVAVTVPKSPFQRLTITPPVIQAAREVFVLALGEKKYVVYEEALRESTNIDAIPARLVLDRTWIFGG